jgi:hypothetical protein
VFKLYVELQARSASVWPLILQGLHRGLDEVEEARVHVVSQEIHGQRAQDRAVGRHGG